MEIGDVIQYIPIGSLGPKGEGVGKRRPARVVWIHPLGRYAVVERQTDFYKYRETIRLARRKGENKHENDRNHEPQGWRWKNRHGTEPR